MYLWRAHNLVNARLHGDYTEDPQFEKRQFPPKFLCSNCQMAGKFSKKNIRNYLIHYYTAIKPSYDHKNRFFSA